MVIPKNARLNGIPVQLYVLASVLFCSLFLSLLHTRQSSALLPLNKVPIIGQPVANTVHGVSDEIVKPTVNTLTELLPPAAKNTVQAPFATVTDTLNTLAGPPATSPAKQNQSTHLVGAISRPGDARLQSTSPTQTTLTNQNKTYEAEIDQPETRDTYFPVLANSVKPLDTYTPILGVSTKNIAAKTDTSTIIAAGAVLLTITLLFVSIVGMIIHGHAKLAYINGGQSLLQNDLSQASLIIAGFIALGSLFLAIILGN